AVRAGHAELGPSWKPSEYGPRMRAAFASVREGTELSVAKLLELALGREPGGSWRPADRGWFDRAYDLKRYVPQSLKFRAKGALRLALGPWLERRSTGPRTDSLDDAVLDRFGQDPSLAGVDPAWTSADVSRWASAGAEQAA